MNMMTAALAPAGALPITPIYDAEVVEYRLEEAGRTLLALPSQGCLPAGFRSNWPKEVAASAEAYGYGEDQRIRPAPPEARYVTRMDEAFRWLSLLPPDRVNHRRIILLRAMVNPVNERHIWSWRKIGKAYGWSHMAVQRWHAEGLSWIVQALYGQQRAGASWAVLWHEERHGR